MWKTTLYVLVLSAVGAALCLALLTRLDPGAAPSDAPAAVTSGGTVTGALEPGPMSAVRDSERAVVEAQIRALARHPDVLRLVDPARAARQQTPVLRPNQPPTRASSTVVPSADELLAPARTALDNEASALGASLALVDGSTGEVVVETGADAASVVAALGGREALTSSVVSGVMAQGDALADVLTVPVNGGSHWLVAVRPLDAARLAAYDQTLGGTGEVSLVRKGEVSASTAEGALRTTLDGALSQLRTAASLTEMPDALASGTDVGGGRRLRHGVVVEPTLDESPSTTALVFSLPAATVSGAPAATATADDGDADVVSAVRAAFTEPRMPWLVGALSGIVLLALLGWLLVRADRNSWLRQANRKLTLADSLDDVHLVPPAQRLVDTVRERVPPKMVSTAPPLLDAASDEMRAELEQARARANEATLELETAESRARQLQTQVEYARKEVGRAQTRATELETDRDAQRKRVEALEGELAEVRAELERMAAQVQATAIAPAVADEPATVVSPAVEVGPTELDAADGVHDLDGVLDSTDALFASAFQALDSSPRVKAQAAQQALERGRTLETPRVDTAETRGARLNRKPGRDYDTAEVDGDEMSQLLDEIDTKTTGEFGQIEIPGEAYPSEEFADLPGSLENLADELGSMSDSQIRRLDEVDDPENVDRDPRRVDPSSGEFVSPDVGNRTAQLFSVSRQGEGSVDRTTLPAHGVGRQTLPGGLRVASRNEDDGEETPSHATAPPPWKKGSAPPRSLSPASLLEALKKRGQSAPEAPEPAAEGSDSTRVARFSRGLLDKTPVRQAKPRSVSQSGLFSRTGSRVDIDPTNDSEYFKSLYDDFVETKRRCGENTDKITLDRFVTRLARNKKQLMDRYGCRTVRFQVYVKSGKAALKATPVK